MSNHAQVRNQAETQTMQIEILFIILLLLACSIIVSLVFLLLEFREHGSYGPGALTSSLEDCLAVEDGDHHVAAWEGRSALDPALGEKYEYNAVLKSGIRNEAQPLFTIAEEEETYGTF
jgi:hypothetical protein